MKRSLEKYFPLTAIVGTLLLILWAVGPVDAETTPPNTFTNGTTIDANEVNANFNALAAAIDAIPPGAKGLNWKGAWLSTTSYVADDAVAHLGSAYVSSGPTTVGVAPPAAGWDLLAMKGDQGASGSDGAAGATGVTGLTGPEGPPGTTSWTDGVGKVTTNVNVGIGTTAPAEKLDIVGGQVIIDNNQGYVLRGLAGSGGSTPFAGSLITSSNEMQLRYNRNDTGSKLTFYQGNFGNPVMTLTSISGMGGNVGIGTTTPNEQFEIAENFRLPRTTETTGIIKSGPNRLIHTFGADNFFAGIDAGNLTMTGLGSNTGVGARALQSNTTGAHNTASGAGALRSNTTGNNNTASGVNALVSNTTGHSNTVAGFQALFSNTTGFNNTASGRDALRDNTTGNINTATGVSALLSNTEGDFNTATGESALLNNTTGNNNTASGAGALRSNTTGFNNTASGRDALRDNTTGHSNTASGEDALKFNTMGSGNTASGQGALFSNTEGDSNTASGRDALRNDTTGNDNTASGVAALFNNTTGFWNTASGRSVLLNNSTGAKNTAVGIDGLRANITGSNNTAIGFRADALFTDLTFATAIGSNAKVACSKCLVLGGTGEFAVKVGIGVTEPTLPLQMASGAHVTDGGVWTNASSRAYKENIREISEAEAQKALGELVPVAYNYKVNKDEAYLGFIAEDVPELVATGDRKGLSPMDIVAVLTKVLQNQQKVDQAQRAEIAELRAKLAENEARQIEFEKRITQITSQTAVNKNMKTEVTIAKK